MRPRDWPERLQAVIEDWRARPFVWGVSDCVRFAAAAVTAVSGRDWSTVNFGTYHTARQARKRLSAMGFADLPAAVTALLGAPVARPQRGDLVAVETPQGLALGVCLDDRLAAPGPAGLVFLPLSAARRVWRI